jgi:hypothetical protein
MLMATRRRRRHFSITSTKQANAEWNCINPSACKHHEIESSQISHRRCVRQSGVWYSLDLDYGRITGILADANYTG